MSFKLNNFFRKKYIINQGFDFSYLQPSAEAIATATKELEFSEENLNIIEKRLQNEINFNAERQDSIDKAYDRLLKRKYLYVANFAMNHADHEVAPYLALTEIADINVSYLDSIANKMTPKVSESKYGKILIEHIKDVKNYQ